MYLNKFSCLLQIMFVYIDGTILNDLIVNSVEKEFLYTNKGLVNDVLL